MTGAIADRRDRTRRSHEAYQLQADSGGGVHVEAVSKDEHRQAMARKTAPLKTAGPLWGEPFGLGASQVGLGSGNASTGGMIFGDSSPSHRIPNTPSPIAFHRRRSDLSVGAYPPCSSDAPAGRFSRDSSWRSRGDKLPLCLSDDASPVGAQGRPAVGMGLGAPSPRFALPASWRKGDTSRLGYCVDVGSGGVAASPTRPPLNPSPAADAMLNHNALRHTDIVTEQHAELVDDPRHRSLTSIGGPSGPAAHLPASTMHDFQTAPRFGPRAAPMDQVPLREADPTWSSGLSWAEMSRRGHLPKSMDRTRSEGLLDLSPSRKASGHMFAR